MDRVLDVALLLWVTGLLLAVANRLILCGGWWRVVMTACLMCDYHAGDCIGLLSFTSMLVFMELAEADRLA